MRFLKIILSNFRTFLPFKCYLADTQQHLFYASVNKANHISIMHWHIYYEAFSRYNIVCAELNPAFGLVTQIGQ